jgi:hypothetical protein
VFTLFTTIEKGWGGSHLFCLIYVLQHTNIFAQQNKKCLFCFYYKPTKTIIMSFELKIKEEAGVANDYTTANAYNAFNDGFECGVKSNVAKDYWNDKQKLDIGCFEEAVKMIETLVDEFETEVGKPLWIGDEARLLLDKINKQ